MNFLKASGVSHSGNNLYINKYAPKKFSEFQGNIGVKQTLESFLESGNFRNILINGPHGSAKSILAKLLVKAYLGDENMKNGCLEIYGSLSRGKDVVSEKPSVKNKQKNFNCSGIMPFLKRTTSLPKHLVKVIIIYEFHQMSPVAQMALRRIMEIHSTRIRFVFVTEDNTKVIQALQSRCTPLNLQKLDDNEIDLILDRIIKSEKISDSPDLRKLIKLNADGDIRIAVNLLQLLGKCETEEEWYEILGIPEIRCIEEMIVNCRQGNVLEVYRQVNVLLSQGFEICDFLDILTRVLIKVGKFREKDQYLRILCHDTLTIEECYTETQLYNMLNHFCQISREFGK